MKQKIGVLSQATSVAGQGVGSAYIEQVKLLTHSTKIQLVFNRFKDVKAYHIHTINFSYFLRMVWTKKPVIVYVHFVPSTLNQSIRLPKLIFALFKWYVKVFYRQANYLVVVNPIFIEPLKAMGCKEERIHFIPNYVDPSVFPSVDERSLLRKQFSLTRFTVLGVGQVQHRKGVLDFIEVAKKLPHIHFIWAGGFSFKSVTAGYEELKKAMEKAPSNMTFLGIIPRETLMQYYRACDVFFLPSYDELMPMSVLEAAVCHMPILLRNLSLYKPVFLNHYLTGDSIDSFVLHLTKLMNDHAFYHEAVQQSENLSNLYHPDHVLKQWETFYLDIIKGVN